MNKKILDRVKKLDKKINYLPQHAKSINGYQTIPLEMTSPGMITRISYTGKKVHDPNPIILVLNSGFEGKVHGLALRFLHPAEIVKLRNILILTTAQKVAMFTHIRFDKFGKVDVTNPYDFYHKRLKFFLKADVRKGCYRTYTIGGISKIKYVDYRFQNMKGDLPIVNKTTDAKAPSPKDTKEVLKKKNFTQSIRDLDILRKKKMATIKRNKLKR